MLTFVYSLYPQHTSKQFVLFTQIISTICVLITLFSSPEIFVNFFQYFLYLILIFGIYIIFILYKSILKLESTGFLDLKSAKINVCSGVVFFLVAVRKYRH